MEPLERYEGMGSVKGYSPGEGFVHGDGTSDAQRQIIAGLHGPAQGQSAPIRQRQELTKEEMAGPGGSVYLWTMAVCILLLVTFLLFLKGLFSYTSSFVIVPVALAWIPTVYFVTTWFVRSKAMGIRPRGRRAVWIATAVTAYVAWVAAGGHDFRGAVLIIWPLGIYAVAAVFGEAISTNE